MELRRPAIPFPKTVPDRAAAKTQLMVSDSVGLAEGF
jgi:hypothetical protein